MNKLTLEEAAKRVAYPNGEERNGVSEIIYRVFKEGAEWQRNHVWRKNTEMPSDGMNEDGIGKACLVIINERAMVSYALKSLHGNYCFDSYDAWYAVEEVSEWAYLEDILSPSFNNALEDNKDIL